MPRGVVQPQGSPVARCGGSFDLRHASPTGAGTFDLQLGTFDLGGQKLQHVAQCATTFARGSTASIGYGGYLVLAGRHRLVNVATLTDRSDVCIADGAVLTNEHSLVGLEAPNHTKTRAIHPNCGLAGPEGRLVNAKGAVIYGKSATVQIFTLFTNHGKLRGKVTH